jgi:hypothetical protein
MRRLPSILLSALSVVVVSLPAVGVSAQTTPVPYFLTFVPSIRPSQMPALHSYCLANISATRWLILGGRYQQGLHQFNSNGNFPGPNIYLWSINPTANAAVQVADLSQLNAAVGNSLTATNQECEYNPTTGYWYIFGGYGVTRPGTNFQTFPTATRIPVPQMLAIINQPGITAPQMQTQVAALLNDPANQITVPSLLQVTGGSLSHMASGLEFLAFGQIFTGSYNPFSTNPGFTQTYTNQVVPFTISNCTAAQGDSCVFSVNTSFGAITSTDADQPFNRRDFASAYDIDPKTGLDRFTVFGGVFRPGAIAAYNYPVYITGSGTTVAATPDRSLQQHFGFYQEPAIVVWDGTNIYHTFFGGIGHFFMNQTPLQAQVYSLVTQEGRNDGMPFIQDIGTILETPTGSYQEYVAPRGVPNGNLDGSSVDFIPNLGIASRFQGAGGSVLNLSTFQQGEQQLIGYIYGGIEAVFPLPCTPSHGTQGNSTLYSVYLTRSAWPGLLPASNMTEAVGYYTHDSSAKSGTPKRSAKAADAKLLAATNPCSTSTGKSAPTSKPKP